MNQTIPINTITPEFLCDSSDFVFNIPIYQRLFVWEELQIEQLFNDLLNANKNAKLYYIGIITIVKTNGKLDVVDGQQRLTFLTLFAAYCISKNINKELWKNFLYCYNDVTKKEESRIQYFGRPEDTRDILDYICSRKYNEVKNQNFLKFINCCERFFATLDSKEITTEEFSNYVYRNTAFLFTELPEEYSPKDLNRFFEKMNATGKQLTSIEHLKGKYFASNACSFDCCLNFEESFENLYEDLKKNYDEIVESDNTLLGILSSEETPNAKKITINKIERYSHRSILRPAIFLLHILQVITENNQISREESKLLESFQTEYEKNISVSCKIRFINNFIAEMINYRKWLDKNIIYLSISDANTLEYAFHSTKGTEEENINKELLQYQSMLYVSSSLWQEWVLEAYLAEKENAYLHTSSNTSSNNNDFLKLLKLQDIKRRPLPFIDREVDKEQMTYQKINRYWFWKLDYILWEMVENACLEKNTEPYNLTEDEINAIKKYKFQTNRSIEHLHPQSSDNVWCPEDLHCFGNLAMISSSFNSAQGKDSVGMKFVRFLETNIAQKKLESIKLLLMFKRAKGKESNWTPKLAQKEQDATIELLKSYHNNQKDSD